LIDGADGFWERLEVADLLSWLRLVRNPADDAALVAACASPLVGLSVDGLASVGLLTGDRAEGGRAASLRGALDGDGPLDPDDRRRVRGLFALLDRQRVPGRAADPAALLDEVVAATAYDEHLLRLVGGDRRAANVIRLRRIASTVAASGGSLTDLVERAEKEQGHELRAPEASVAGSDAVVLMTVHQAKGLEFDTVVVAGLGSQQIVSSPALLGGVKKDDRRLGLKLRPSPGAKSRALFDHQELVEELQGRESDELRRVLYVALTRARERLIVSGVGRWTKEGSPFARKPSKSAPVLSWLAPALVPEIDDLIDAATLSAQRSARGIELRVSTATGETLDADRRAPEVVEMPVHVGDGPDLSHLPPVEALPPGPPRVLSYTALAAHARCGLRFHAERVLGLGVLVPADAVDVTPAPVVPAAARPLVPAPTGPATRSEYASAKAAADQPDLFATFDEPTPAAVPVEAERAATERSDGTDDGARVVDAPAAEPGTISAGDPGLAPADVGNAVHDLLERLAPTSTDADLDHAVATATADPTWAAAPAARDEVRDLTTAALRSSTLADLWSAGPPRRELAFTVPVGDGDHLISGFLDAWTLGPDGTAVVVDYKTDRVGAGDLEAKVASEYTLQRDAYALAALAAGADRVRVVHLFLRDPDRPVEATFTPDDVPTITARLEAAIGAVESAGPQATASPDRWVCERCPARGSLCGWSEAATERPPGAGPADAAHEWRGAPDGVAAA
ncbi:MAG: PD-(D/E)XK nuclease family protein, partial [Solirubrobacteraceae bacterium]